MNQSRLTSVVKPLALATLLGGGLLGGAQAWANTAANTGIQNTVTLNYADAGGTAQAAQSASVTVVVSLVPASPTLSAPANQTVATSGSGATATYNYTITTNSNGIETFALTTGQTMSSGLSGYTATPSPTSITLGATTVYTTGGATINIAGGTSSTTITVPMDQTADSSINGLVVGNTVQIGSIVYTVTAIGTDPGGASALNNTTTITVKPVSSSAAAQNNVASGTLIAQQVAFTMAVAPGTDSAPNVSQTDTVVLTAKDNSNTSATANNTTITTVAGSGMSIAKYVRNVTTSGANPSSGAYVLSNNGASYYAAGVGGNPGDTLEYLIVVTKNVVGNNSTNVIITDSVPAFVAYKTGSMYIDQCNGTFGGTALTEAADGDAGTEVAGGTNSTGSITFYPGTTLGKGSPATGGTIANSGTVTCNMIYRVTIN